MTRHAVRGAAPRKSSRAVTLIWVGAALGVAGIGYSAYHGLSEPDETWAASQPAGHSGGHGVVSRGWVGGGAMTPRSPVSRGGFGRSGFSFGG